MARLKIQKLADALGAEVSGVDVAKLNTALKGKLQLWLTEAKAIQWDYANLPKKRALEKLTKFYPLRRLGTPADVAPMVVLLASDAGSWITGQIISISGGFSMA